MTKYVVKATTQFKKDYIGVDIGNAIFYLIGC